ncbi:MAG TPA: divalent-cation tolerance protein CutA [bacterium]|mgnify:FL=1|nr:divalent-cation tolerance protein CutA [bacterium]
MASKYLQVITATGSQPAAKKLARVLVQEKLAACVQIVGPVTSIYWWQGKVEHSQEWLCLMKTTAGLYPRLEKRLRKLHSYQVPEVIGLGIACGSQAYLSWLKSNVSSKRNRTRG